MKYSYMGIAKLLGLKTVDYQYTVKFDRNLGTTLRIDYLYNVLNSLDLKINKASMLRRIEYITELRQSAKGCYEV